MDDLIIDRIMYIAEKENITLTSLEKKIEASKGVLTRAYNKKTDIQSKWVTRIAENYPLYNAFWILTGTGDHENETSETREDHSPYYNLKKGTPLIPVNAFAGLSHGNVSIMEQDIMERYLVPDFTNVDFMIRIKGSSMYPKYNSGDVVACKMINSESFLQWNKVHVIATKEQGVLIKRIDISEKEDCIKAVSDNEKYKPFDIPKDEILNIALVTGVIRLE